MCEVWPLGLCELCVLVRDCIGLLAPAIPEHSWNVGAVRLSSRKDAKLARGFHGWPRPSARSGPHFSRPRDRPLGGRHARCRYDRIQRGILARSGWPSSYRRASHHRALHADQRADAALRGDYRSPKGIHQALDDLLSHPVRARHGTDGMHLPGKQSRRLPLGRGGHWKIATLKVAMRRAACHSSFQPWRATVPVPREGNRFSAETQLLT
jgi:hypothetical protein